jgi:hypothetical protein
MTKIEYWGKINLEKIDNLRKTIDDIIRSDSRYYIEIRNWYQVHSDGSERKLAGWEQPEAYLSKRKNTKIKCVLGYNTFGKLCDIVIGADASISCEQKWYYFDDEFGRNCIRKSLKKRGLIKNGSGDPANNMYPLTKLRGVKF